MGVSLDLSQCSSRNVRRFAMNRSPFTGRGAFPLVKSTEEGVGVFVTKKISGFVQFEGGVQQVVLREFTASLFHQLLELGALCGEAALQGSCTQAQFAGNILQSRSLAGKKLLQNSFHLFP